MVVELIRLRMKRVVDRIVGFGIDLPFTRCATLKLDASRRGRGAVASARNDPVAIGVRVARVVGLQFLKVLGFAWQVAPPVGVCSRGLTMRGVDDVGIMLQSDTSHVFAPLAYVVWAPRGIRCPYVCDIWVRRDAQFAEEVPP